MSTRREFLTHASTAAVAAALIGSPLVISRATGFPIGAPPADAKEREQLARARRLLVKVEFAPVTPYLRDDPEDYTGIGLLLYFTKFDDDGDITDGRDDLTRGEPAGDCSVSGRAAYLLAEEIAAALPHPVQLTAPRIPEKDERFGVAWEFDIRTTCPEDPLCKWELPQDEIEQIFRELQDGGPPSVIYHKGAESRPLNALDFIAEGGAP